MSSPGAHTRQFNDLSRSLECNELVCLLSSSGAPNGQFNDIPRSIDSCNEQVYLKSSPGASLDSLGTYPGHCNERVYLMSSSGAPIGQFTDLSGSYRVSHRYI